MKPSLQRTPASKPAVAPPFDLPKMGAFIKNLQLASGEIPWSDGGKTDPWDHVESAMGLAATGFVGEAEKAYLWLAETQLPDGSWYYSYEQGKPKDKTKDANMSSYIAVGLLHYYLITANLDFVREMWPTVSRGINFAVSLQAPGGEIYWAKDAQGQVDKMALLTGSSSVFMSLKCALLLGTLLEVKVSHWRHPWSQLGKAISSKPNLFNMMKSRFSMDWYYPILSGAIEGRDARDRISRYWDKFVVPGWGVRCVSDHPWVTLAETAELILSLTAIEEHERARFLLSWITEMKYDDGSYWMGVTFPDNVVWPEERTSWTAGAIILAYDSLYRTTPGHLLFRHRFWRRVIEADWLKNDGLIGETGKNPKALFLNQTTGND